MSERDRSLDAPFPWFGGKRKAVELVWPRLGVVENYVEPFFGSGAMLLGRPDPVGLETVNDLYTEDSESVAHAVREWAIANGDNRAMRIALCGYKGEHEMPASWSVVSWNAGQGYGAQAAERSGNGRRERIWFSPHCLPPEQPGLFS